MIANITKGKSATGALRYDHGAGRKDEHENPHKVAGNVEGKTWRERGLLMDRHHQTTAPRAAKPVHRVSLSLDAGKDRTLTDREWKQISEAYVRSMGYDKGPWEATRHGANHVHLTMSERRWDGTRVASSHDRRKARAAVDEIEQAHGLARARASFGGSTQVQNGERESAIRRGVTPEREQIRNEVSQAAQGAQSHEQFQQHLAERGIDAAPSTRNDGTVFGYAFHQQGHVDADGHDVWIKASSLGNKDLSGGALAKQIERNAAEHAGPTGQQQAEALMRARQDKTLTEQQRGHGIER